MKNIFLQKIFNQLKSTSVVVGALLLLNSANVVDTSESQMLKVQIAEMQSELTCYQSEVALQESEICDLQEYLTEPLNKAQLLLKDRKSFQHFVDTNGVLPSTKFELSDYKDIDCAIDPHLYAALIEYSELPTTPKVLVTSIKRAGSVGSRHRVGKALDIRINEDAHKLLIWLSSEEGRQWATNNKIRFFIEDVSNTAFLRSWKGIHPKSVFLNTKATGPHVHLEVRI